jgi:hypothetical protein
VQVYIEAMALKHLSYIIFLLLIFFGLGIPFSRGLPRNSSVMIAPALGFSVYGIIAVLFYYWGASLNLVFWVCVSLAMTSLCWNAIRNGWCQESVRYWLSEAISPAIFGSLTLLLLLLPLWLAGPQFSAFQGNFWDHFNYLAGASAFAKFSHAEIMNANSPVNFASNFIPGVRAFLEARPTVSLVFGSSFRPFFESTIEGSYSFNVLLQFLSFFSMFALIKLLFPTWRLRAGFAAMAFTSGFLLQYIFDINAWSQLASIPIAIAALSLTLYAFLQATAVEKAAESIVTNNLSLAAIVFASLPLAVTWAGLLFFYPESLPIYGAAVLGALIVALCSLNSLRQIFRRSNVSIALGFLLAIAVSLLYWRGIWGTFLFQFRNVSSGDADYYTYFQRHLFGYDLAYFPWLTGRKIQELPSAVYAAISLPVDVIFGMTGLYPMLPAEDVPLQDIAIWKLIFLTGIAIFFACSTGAIFQLLRSKQSFWKLFVGASIASFSFVVLLVFVPRYWAAGKALSMAAPMLFVFFLLPLTTARTVIGIAGRIATGVLLLTQIGWAIARPISAVQAIDGLHYLGKPALYPSYLSGFLKQDYDWNFARWNDVVKNCSAIDVNIKSQFVDWYVQIWLSDLNVKWASSQPLRALQTVEQPFGRQDQLLHADCLVTDSPQLLQPGQRLLTMLRKS